MSMIMGDPLTMTRLDTHAAGAREQRRGAGLACCDRESLSGGAVGALRHRRNTPSVSNLQLNLAALHRCCPIDRFYPRALYT
ncbi:hypothetical protein CBM2615_A320006 [Cupriavidus taiwanensis]|uniref:Uncharacterized protein n=1 Tax=Cupriavidus taiwanensis TaxID=164546 RepID=A0A976AXC1_9BURK|nr:hypothetical protein CBM2615_A320006 [Cupriavidus taiwanensis]SOZ58240.1 hypothetical protein CBM2614_A280006 [Cupriavidus taiwanensis]SOZ61338.1 hypothetical protein CBM2613_A290006 [Cupriavidus taiwanensis]SPA05983.1 hypothetical protein CBM2625_A230006 [Cupriavidus taiwanensis]